MAQANRNQPVAPFVAPNVALPPEVLDFLRQPVANENDPVFAAIVRDVAERGEGRVMGAAAIRDRRRHADRVAGEVAETRRDLIIRLTAFSRDWSRSVALSNQVVKDEKSRQERDEDDSERRREIARRKRELRAVTHHYEEKKRLRNEKESEGLLEWNTHCPTALLARETAANDSRVDRARQRNRVRVEDVSDEAQPDGQAESKQESKLDANAAPPHAAETGQLLLPAPAAAAGAAGQKAPPAARASTPAVPAPPPAASPAPAAASASAARAAGAAAPATPSVTDARAPAATKAKTAAPSAAPANAARAAPVPPPGAARAVTQAVQAAVQNLAQAQPSVRNVAGAPSTQPVSRRHPAAAAALQLGREGMDTAE